MNFWSRLFGKKKKLESLEPSEETQAEEIRKEDELKEDARHITLEDVEKELDDLNKAEAVKEAPKPESKPETAAAAEKCDYHIKKHPKGWQIIAADADRAYRVFDTQKEAIDFAKENEMDYLLYRVDGTLRQ